MTTLERHTRKSTKFTRKTDNPELDATRVEDPNC